MRIVISPRAEKELKRTPKIHQIAIVKKIRSLTSSHGLSREKLIGYKDIYRVRVSQYRIVYRQRSDEIFIVLIGHRKDIYRLLNQLILK